MNKAETLREDIVQVDVDRQSRVVWTILAAMGAVLAIVGWMRWGG